MDEKIIRLCEENNVPSLVQALSTLKNQKVCVISLPHSAKSDEFCLPSGRVNVFEHSLLHVLT